MRPEALARNIHIILLQVSANALALLHFTSYPSCISHITEMNCECSAVRRQDMQLYAGNTCSMPAIHARVRRQYTAVPCSAIKTGIYELPLLTLYSLRK